MGLALKDSPPGFDPAHVVDTFADDDDDQDYAETSSSELELTARPASPLTRRTTACPRPPRAPASAAARRTSG